MISAPVRSHTFPLGSFAQKKEDFHITNLGNTLYVLTPRGLFRGECKSSSLQKLLAFRELQLPPQSNILTMFSGSADSLYLVIKEADGSKSIRLIHLPSQNLSDQNHPESKHTTQKVWHGYLPEEVSCDFCPFCLMADISETVMLVAFSPSVSTLTMSPGLILLTDISVLSSPDFLYILVCVKCVTDYFACNSSSVKS